MPHLLKKDCCDKRGYSISKQIVATKSVFFTYKEFIMREHVCNVDLKSSPKIWNGFAEDRDDRKSTSGYIFTLAGGAISWKSSKQSIVASSMMYVLGNVAEF